MGRRRRSGWTGPGRIWLVLAVLALHLPHLSGWLSENPVWFTADLVAPAPQTRSAPLLGLPGFIDGNAGVTLQALGGRAARDWLAGRVPWWNPYSGLGMPLAAELQNGAFFLPFVLLLRLFDGVVWLKIGLQILAGLFCRAFLAELGLAPLAALVAALCFELNGSFAWFGHGPILPIAFLPLLLWGVERARTRPAAGALLVGLGIGFSLLAGFPEVAYLDGLLALVWFAVRLPGAPDRLRMAGGILAGGSAGLLLAAPPLLAFAQALPLEFIGFHQNFAGTVLPPAARAGLLFPYLFGPPYHGVLALHGAASTRAAIGWYRRAAYLDLPLCLLASMALRPFARRMAPRLALGLFVLVGLGRVCGAPLLTPLADHVPLLPRIMANLYLLPALQMAITVLAGFGFDDWLAGDLARPALLAALPVLALAVASLPGAGADLAALRAIPHEAFFPLASGGLAAFAAVATLGLAARAPRAGARRLMVGLLSCHAALLFAVPLLCGQPHPRALDRAGIRALAGLPATARVETEGVLAPNYGALFGIHQLDTNYLPAPSAWVGAVRTALPGFDGVNFYPRGRAVGAAAPSLAWLRALGVGYVALPAATDPFTPAIAVPMVADPDGLGRALPLDHAVSLTLAGRLVPGGTVRTVDVTLGTYAGHTTGTLGVRLCQLGRCVSGSGALDQAIDDAPFRVPVPALALNAGADLTLTLSPAGSWPPALWLDHPMRASDASILPGLAPHLAIRLVPPPDALRPIFADRLLTLYQLADAAPAYAAPGCTLRDPLPDSVVVSCPAAAALVRRVLAFPGWRARLGSRPVPVGSDGLFQRVALPPGTARLVFRYRPAGARVAYAASALGSALLLGFALIASRPPGRRRMTGASIP